VVETKECGDTMDKHPMVGGHLRKLMLLLTSNDTITPIIITTIIINNNIIIYLSLAIITVIVIINNNTIIYLSITIRSQNHGDNIIFIIIINNIIRDNHSDQVANLVSYLQAS